MYCDRVCFGQANSGENHHAYKGGVIEQNGYIRIRVNGEYIAEHRHVMETHIGRQIMPWETVHHIDGDKKNNDIRNLELWGSRHPRGQRFVDWMSEMMSKAVSANPRCFAVADFASDPTEHRQFELVNVDTGATVIIPIA